MGSPNVGCMMPSSNAISHCAKSLTLPSPIQKIEPKKAEVWR